MAFFISEKSTVYVKGEKEDILFVLNKIKDILLKEASTHSEPDSQDRGRRREGVWKPHNRKGSDRYWKEMEDNHTTPPYWKKFKGGVHLRNIVSKFKQEDRCHIYDVDGRTFKAIESLVNDTWDDTHVGHGKDAAGLQHQAIKVTKVERIENLDLREKYLHERSILIRRLRDHELKQFPALEHIQGCQKGEIMTTKVMNKLLSNDMHPDLNEHYLFHGTKAEYVRNIAHKGVDSRKAGDRAMLGCAVYCAESSTKADQYSGNVYLVLNIDNSSASNLMGRFFLGL